MEERARSCLLRSKDTLEQDIKASYLMDHMVSDDILTNDEEARVLGKPTRREQATALLEVLLRKDNRAYISFYNALVRESYGDLANLLHSDLPLLSPEGERSFADGVSPSVQAILREGGVPQRPVVFVSRPTLLNLVREKLYWLKNTPGWVTVFGMAGSGKSVMAAEAVRDHALIKECFPGGVHWLSVGQCERADLLVRIQSLCFRLEQGQSSDASLRPPCSVEEAKERLRFLMHRRFPRSLLILDDVWDSFALRSFDIQCRVLLTTRNRSLADSVSGTRFEVPVESGLDEEKALEILALYVNGKPQKLPEEARSIVSECKGSPLVVSLIGALLREFPDRWSYYLLQLQKKQFKRIRKSSSYDYEALDQAMDASLQVLEPEHRDLYRDLSVMQKDINVPAKVLSVLWGLELEEVEDILQEFVNKSLLFRDCNQRPYHYYLHDLQLDFLVEQNRDQIAELHKKMIRQYQQFYNERPPSSGDIDCLYWYRFLPYHMAKAGLSKELYSLMFSLDWVKEKAQIMGSAHLINDYVEYGEILDKENSEVRLQFQEFLSLNGHHLELRPFPDIVQLALSQPVCSEVYRQALMQAQKRASRGQLCLDWVNKNNKDSLSRLVMHPHQGSVYYACFSKDGSKIASCGANKALRVFKTTSGEKLLELQAHDEDVLCCSFSPDDRYIATCSSDRKVKLWSVERGTLIREFGEEHEEQINHCQFTNTGRRVLLATCSNDKFTNTKLWNPNKPTSQNTMFGHMEPVNHCCFSPNDAYLATSSSDGTLKLFEVSSANEWKSIDVNSFFPESDDEIKAIVKCSTWSADGSRLDEIKAIVKCSTWSVDGSRIICAARNAVFVSDFVSVVVKCCGTWETDRVHTSSAAALKRDSDVLFSHSDVTIVAPDSRNRLQVRTGSAGAILFESEELLSRIRCTCISRNASFVALGTEDGTVQVLEVPSGKTSLKLTGHTRTVHHCQFTDDGETLITSSEDTTVRVWKWRTGECLVLEGHKEPVRKFHLLNNSSSSHLFSWSFDGTLKVWDLNRGHMLQDLECHKGAVLSCDVSSDGHLFATTSADRTAKVWSSASWENTFLLKGHKDCVRSCRFSWNNKRLATGDDNGEIRLWSMLDGALLKICSRDTKDSMDSFHGGWVTDLHFSPDNRVLVSTGGYIKWWSVETGEALQTFYTMGANLKKIHVSPYFTTFVTVDGIGILYVLKKVEGGSL
ncbi:apoptotic protease-activating factor 1-like [Sinocyclocheilus anshuiensis]|uniref:apoptotic protease-activating factor 1-like n=1 Tax=Sinocyclocheilus anshuiensis TaxID=1608454 RepID=UPI0007BA8C01|nr:PREDICTED: apoptotic protease-activating factor 1-like [Sinocyclocheilus anshuiensis]